MGVLGATDGNFEGRYRANTVQKWKHKVKKLNEAGGVFPSLHLPWDMEELFGVGCTQTWPFKENGSFAATVGLVTLPENKAQNWITIPFGQSTHWIEVVRVGIFVLFLISEEEVFTFTIENEVSRGLAVYGLYDFEVKS